MGQCSFTGSHPFSRLLKHNAESCTGYTSRCVPRTVPTRTELCLINVFFLSLMVLLGLLEGCTVQQATGAQHSDKLMQDSMDVKKRKDEAALHTIRETAAQLNLPITYHSKHILNTLADNRPHQGVLLDCEELPFSPMDVLPTVAELEQLTGPGAPAPVWLVVDEISDPVWRPLHSFATCFTIH
jgi:hypothetical protein